jgi:hypothetical protein
MKRSTGITISAVIVLLGSAATFLFESAILLVLLLGLVPMQTSQPPFVKYAVYFEGILLLGFAAWGVATGVGLLRLRNWARVSLLVLSGLLLFFSLPVLIIVLVNPEVFRQIMLGVRISLALRHGVFSALSSFWLWFLNTRATREQFEDATKSDLSVAKTPRRPVSISIIGCYLLIDALRYPADAFFPFPAFLLGFLLKGRSATAIILLQCALQVVAGIGVLKLKPWARIISIYYFAFLLVNSFTMVLIPGTRARFEEALAEIQRLPFIPPIIQGISWNQMRPWLWPGFAFAVLFSGVPLWFLITNKRTFAPTQQPSN